MARGVTFRDLVLGVEFPLVEGFTLDTGKGLELTAVKAGRLTTSYGVSPLQDPETLIRRAVEALAQLSTMTGLQARPRVGARGGAVVALVGTPFGPVELGAWRAGGLTRFYATDGSTSREWLGRMAGRARLLEEPGGVRSVIPDPLRGIPALELVLPEDCSARHHLTPASLSLEVSCSVGSVRADTWSGLSGGPMVAQLAASRGLLSSPPPSLESLIPRGRWESRLRTGAPPVAARHKGEMIAYRLQGMPGAEEGLLLIGEGRAGWVWLVWSSLALPMVGRVTSWTAGRAIGRGELAGSLLLTILSHLRVREELLRALQREAQAEYARAVRNIREMGRMSRSIARSFRPRGTSATPPPSAYTSSQASSSGEWSSEYTPGDEILGDEVEERWGDTWGGQADYYLDQDGMIRNYDSGEETVGELGDDGVIYDSEGRQIGYIQDGYIYDYETGEQVGVFHREASDQYQMELAEQRAADPDAVYGPPEGAEALGRPRISPYHASREEDREE